MCTEAVSNALNYSGALNPLEFSILIEPPYQPWGNSFPAIIHPDFVDMAPSVAGLTLPNPNAFEERINLLNQTNNVHNVNNMLHGNSSNMGSTKNH